MGLLSGYKNENTESVTPELGESSGSLGATPSPEVLAESITRPRGRPKTISEGSQSTNARATKKAMVTNNPLLFTAKTWGPIASLPFTVRRVMTGSEIFRLSKDESELLGESLAVIMDTLLKIDPKYIALTVFISNTASIFVEKELAYKLAQKKT